jgi:hypothetical protein
VELLKRKLQQGRISKDEFDFLLQAEQRASMLDREVFATLPSCPRPPLFVTHTTPAFSCASLTPPPPRMRLTRWSSTPQCEEKPRCGPRPPRVRITRPPGRASQPSLTSATLIFTRTCWKQGPTRFVGRESEVVPPTAMTMENDKRTAMYAQRPLTPSSVSPCVHHRFWRPNGSKG